MHADEPAMDVRWQTHIIMFLEVAEANKQNGCMKNNKWSQKGLKIDDVALNGAFWTHKKSGVQISSKNEIPL